MAQPSAKAFRFVIDGQNQQYDAYLEAMQPSGFAPWIECRYRTIDSAQDKWVYLGSSKSLDKLDTTENTDASFDKALADMNAKIKEVFKTAGNDIPLKGFKRVQWLLQVGLKEIDNVISRVS